MPDSKLNLKIIIASTRPGRLGLPIGQWAYEHSKDHPAFQIELIDLAEVNLPLLDEPNPPAQKQYTKEHTKRWSQIVASADAFVFVNPEYSHGFPASLKNALDYLHEEWMHKPVGFISYGWSASGTRSQQLLKPVLNYYNMMPLSEAVNIALAKYLDDQGQFKADEDLQRYLKTMLDKLALFAKHFRNLRQEIAAQSK